MKKTLLIPLGILAAAIGFSQTQPAPKEAPRRVEVLFVGAPTANGPGHDPVERYRVIRKQLGTAGINFTYTEDLADFRRDVLDRYDAVMLYGNWKQNEPMDPAQEKALLGYVEEGGAFLPIHCASACFGGSEAFVKLVGGRFKSHGAEVFTTKITMPDHPIMRGYEGFETWDETYVHDRLTDDRTVLQVRDKEPWTWVRKQGQGNVFYTAYGHDMRCWEQPAFNELLRRAILWSVGPEVRAQLAALKLPQLETEDVILPGYREKKTITKAQKPLSPADSMRLAQVPGGFEISLFASEPDIVNPIYVAWDHKGRAFVVQTVDYPNNLQAGNIGHDSIKICEDTNGDGKADKFTVFADKLSIPTSMLFANGGVICTNGSEMLFLKDTNGDDKADVRQVLFDGFNTGDTHAGVSNLRYGFDNWIYATIGYAGFSGKVGGEEQKFSTGAFRFKPDGSKLEFLQTTTNNTWGLGFTSEFDILGSTANGNPSWYLTFPKSLYEKFALTQGRTPAGDNNPKFFPSSMDIRQVDQMDKYTSAAGHGFYTSTRLPERYRDRIAFVTEPTGKLVGDFEVTRKGSGFVSKQLPNNIFSSADAWSSPVFAETGPDGAVWIADWYNLIIQHNPTPSKNSAGYDAKNGRGNAYESPLRDTQYGRIYRVYPKGTPNDTNPKLDPAVPATLLAGLGHPNLFWRLEAQRLIIETLSASSASAAPKLKEIVKTGAPKGDPAATHALLALQGLGVLDTETIAAGLVSTNRATRRAALANATDEATLTSAVIRGGVVFAEESRELAETFVALSRLAPSDEIGKALHATLAARKGTILGDKPLEDAWQMAARQHSAAVLAAAAAAAPAGSSAPTVAPNLLPNADFSELGGWTLRAHAVPDPSALKMEIAPGGRNGGSALMIQSTASADAGAGIDISVKPNTRYVLGGWIRTEDFRNTGGRGAMLNVHGMDATAAVSGTKDWSEVSMEFDSENSSRITVHCLFGGYGGGTGKAFYDDVYLREIGSADISASIKAVAAYGGSKGQAAPKVATKKFPVDPAVHERGQAVFNLTCIACHGADGKGVPHAFPPLDGASWAVGDPTVPARIVMGGLQGPIEVSGETFNSVMPPHPTLKDQEIADVLTFVRQSWTNDAAPVSVDVIKQTRAKHGTRALPWTAAELK